MLPFRRRQPVPELASFRNFPPAGFLARGRVGPSAGIGFVSQFPSRGLPRPREGRPFGPELASFCRFAPARRGSVRREPSPVGAGGTERRAGHNILCLRLGEGLASVSTFCLLVKEHTLRQAECRHHVAGNPPAKRCFAVSGIGRSYTTSKEDSLASQAGVSEGILGFGWPFKASPPSRAPYASPKLRLPKASESS